MRNAIDGNKHVTHQFKPRQRIRYHDCQNCMATGTIHVLDYYGRGDIVMCLACGAGYQIQSRRPFRMQIIIEDDD